MDIFYDILNFSNSDNWIGIISTCLISLMPFSIMGFLFAKHRNEEPSYLIGFDRMDGLTNAWTLLLVLTAPLVFTYNVFVWTGYAFVVFAQFISYILKKIYEFLITPILKAIKWLFNAILWIFINLFWIPIRMLGKSFYHYCILWSWDLYKTSFLSLNGTYKYSRMRVTFIAAFYAIVIIGLATYFAILTNFAPIGIVGFLVAILPLIKAYGTTTSMLHYNDERDHSEHGIKVMKSALNYIIVAIVSVVAIAVLLLLSWIPDFGLVFLGISINANVFLSAIVILSLIVLFFAQSIFPNHLLYNEETTSMRGSVINYLSVIRDKGLQLIVSLIPGSLWTALVLVVPILLIIVSVSSSDSFKTNTLSIRANNIDQDISEANIEVGKLTAEFKTKHLSDIENAFETAIELNVRSNQNAFGLGFPKNVIDQPEIIFSDNITEYTNVLQNMLAGAINDTVIIRNQIKDSELLVNKITNHIIEYKSQDWKFKIQRKAKKDGKDDWKTMFSGNDITAVIDMNVREGRSYVYRVQAVNDNGKSNWSTQLGESIAKRTLTAPSNLRINSELNFRIIFSWNDNSNSEDAFVIERRLSNDDKWSEYATVGPDLSQYVVSDVRSKHVKKYDYRISSQRSGKKSSPSSNVSFQLKLDSPKRLNTSSNLKSVLVDWAYNFGYSTEKWDWIKYRRYEGSITPNVTDAAAISLTEKSLADIIQEKIDKQKELLIQLNMDLEFAKEKISMFYSLVDYDKSQRIMLKVFKNFAFLFAILFAALFGGIIFAVTISYMSSLFYNVFNIRGNDPWYFISLIKEEQKKNKNQPLLALTIWLLVFLFFSSASIFALIV